MILMRFKCLAQIKIVTQIEISKKFERLFPLRVLDFLLLLSFDI